MINSIKLRDGLRRKNCWFLEEKFGGENLLVEKKMIFSGMDSESSNQS